MSEPHGHNAMMNQQGGMQQTPNATCATQLIQVQTSNPTAGGNICRIEPQQIAVQTHSDPPQMSDQQAAQIQTNRPLSSSINNPSDGLQSKAAGQQLSQQQHPGNVMQLQQQQQQAPMNIGEHSDSANHAQHQQQITQQQQQQQQQMHSGNQGNNSGNNPLSVQQSVGNAGLGNSQNNQIQQQMQQQHAPQSVQQQIHLQQQQPGQNMGPPSAHPQHQTMINQGGMIRVSLPIQNLQQGMQGIQTLASIGGMQGGMQGLPQLQQLQNVQHIQGMSQMQGLQQIQGLQHVQGMQSIQGLQGVQVLGPMHNFQGQQILQQQYIPNTLFPSQFQAQMVSPAVNIQSMQAGPSKSPGITIQQQPIHIHHTQQQVQGQQHNPQAAGLQQGQQQQGSQAAVISNSQAGSSGSITPTKDSGSVGSRVGQTPPLGVVGPSSQHQLIADQHQQQQQQTVIGIQASQLQQQHLQQQRQMVQPPPQHQRQPQQQPVVIGQIAGVISNQSNPNIVNPPKSPIIAHQGNQVLSNQPIRFANQPTIVNSQGQILSQPMMNQFPGGTVLASQPVYIRATGPQQQMCVQMAGGSKPREVRPVSGSILQGARTLGPGIQAVQMAPAGIRMRAPAQRMIRPMMRQQPQKAITIQRNIQPKPPVSAVTGIPSTTAPIAAVTSLPIAMVSPKPVMSKSPQQAHRVVSSTVPISPMSSSTVPISPMSSSAIDSLPCSSIVNSVNQGVSMVNKALSDNNEILDPPCERKLLIEREVVKKEEPDYSKPVSSNITTVMTTNSSTSAPLTMEPKAPPGADFVVTKMSEKKQAIVKPVLTHVIEGFVIQEASEPFPVNRSNGDGGGDMGGKEMDMETDKSNVHSESSSIKTQSEEEDNKKNCQYHYCKKPLPASKLKLGKRFCSKVCAKRYNVSCSKRVGLSNSKKQNAAVAAKAKQREEDAENTAAAMSPQLSVRSEDLAGGGGGGAPWHEADEAESSREASTTDGESTTGGGGPDEGSVSPARSPPELERVEEMDVSPSAARRKPLQQWNVHDVFTFLNSLPGCAIYSDMFLSQEIDGQALMLLKEDHLMTTMNIKLGPALKICASIKQILEEG